MDYVRITSIDHPFFPKLHQLLSTIFPPEEVLEYSLWKEPLEDPGIHVYVAVHEGEVVGATEYRYYKDTNVAMTDFTIIGRPGLGIGRFLLINREKDLRAMAKESGQELFGMFAEIYDPFRAGDHGFGGVTPMNPYVRREVLSHVGYRKLDMEYVHPSWDHSGAAVTGLDLCFLTTYYAVLPNKPAEWKEMIEKLRERPTIPLLPL